MGKISQVSAKYIVHTQINIEGIVDRPDVIGAIFGQTEGLLGSDLELRELQRNGKIGRIEVKLDTKAGKASGSIIIPSSLDKAETAIIAAALETIQRIGPCNAKVNTEKIEDVRISKRNHVIQRAKELLKDLTDKVLPDSQEITEEVAHSVRMMEITEYGKDRLPAGPTIADSEEIILVEGRADVLNLLKHGIKNVIALNGTSVPQTIKDLSRQKIVTVFVDGDRGGDLIIKELLATSEIDYISKAPDGKEVEEITKKEIHKAIRSKVASEQMKLELNGKPKEYKNNHRRTERTARQPQRTFKVEKPKLSKKYNDLFKDMLDDLIGTRGAYILDQDTNVLGKVPTSELTTTIQSLGTGIFAIILDGEVDSNLARTAERAKVKYLVAMDSKIPSNSNLSVLTKNSF